MGREEKSLTDGRQVVVVKKKGMSGCGLILCIVAALFIFFVVLPLGGCSVLLGALGFAVNEAAKNIEETKGGRDEPERSGQAVITQSDSNSERGSNEPRSAPVVVEGVAPEVSKEQGVYFAATPKKAEKGSLTIDDEKIDGIVRVTLKEGAQSTPVVSIFHSGGIKKVRPSLVPLAFAELWGYSDGDVAKLIKLIAGRQKAE